MLTTIICNTREDSNYVYDLLVSKVQGNGPLAGSKTCIDPHELIDQGMTFDLTFEEIDELKKLTQVLSVKINEPTEASLFNYTRKKITGFPKLATKFPPSNQMLSHSLLYCQNYKLNYIQNNSTQQMTLSTIDCSNVDVLVIDSGIDGNHPDLTDDNGNKLLVEFEWGKLEVEVPANLFTQNATGVVKLTQNRIPANYYTKGDPGGHGTACASLIVGKRCGFARNAKLYSLKGIGSGDSYLPGGAETALKLALAFIKAKKQNLYGLNSSRPTIVSNSWGQDTSMINPVYAKNQGLNGLIDEDHKMYIRCSGKGFFDLQLETLYDRTVQLQNTLYDEYTREILKEGGHFIRAAGNSNAYYDLNSPIYSWHVFFKVNNNNQITGRFLLLKTKKNANIFKNNTRYGSYVYRSDQELSLRLYSSPDIGIDAQTNKPYNNYEYPIIMVGDIIPIGDSNITDYTNYVGSTGDSFTAYNALNKIKDDEQRIKINKSVRYTSRKGPFFVKSNYSNYGPSIDIYAPGNGTWAAHSSTEGAEQPSAEFSSPDNSAYKYKYFNGTSAACPIVAGVLATYLSQYPTATPRQAKEWLIKNAVKGNIMETTKTEKEIKTISQDKEIVNKLPHGSNPEKVEGVIAKITYIQNAELQKYFNTLTTDDLLFAFRFFDTPNLIAQAFPLRNAVLAFEDTQVTLGNTVLVKGKSTTEAVTHTP